MHVSALQVVLDYVVQIAFYMRELSLENDLPDPVHLQWIDGPVYPDPAQMLLPDAAFFEQRIAALLLLLRSPESYDASTDFMFERYMKCVISLLVPSDFILFLQ